MENHEPNSFTPYKSKEGERVYRHHLLDASIDAFSCVGGADMGGLASCCRYSTGLFGSAICATDNGIFLQGVQHCHSISCCPVCSYSLGVERCNEIGSFIWCVRKEHKGVYLVSLDCSHKIDDDFSSLLKSLMSASMAMWRDGSLRRVLSSVGFVGRITSFECMMGGVNGFHPHFHILVIADEGLDVDFLGGLFLAEWKKSLKASGLFCNEHGCDCLGYEGVGDYITKMQSELSLLNATKNYGKGKSGSMSPMQYLRMWDLERNPDYAETWVNYVKTVKGKRVNVWSRGLKDYASRLREKYDIHLKGLDNSDMEGLIVLDNFRDYQKLKPEEWRLLIELIYKGKLDSVRTVLDARHIPYYANNNAINKFLKVHLMN